MECREWIVRNEEVHRRAGIEREFASRADQRVLRWFGHVERMDEYRMARRVLMAEVRGVGWGTRETEVRLDGWCEGGLRKQSNDGGRCERPERVESPGTYVTEEFHVDIFAWPCALSDPPPMLWWLSHGEGRDAVT